MLTSADVLSNAGSSGQGGQIQTSLVHGMQKLESFS